MINFKISKIVLLAILLFVKSNIKIQAQTPTSCFEIESILVAACGQPEGENEMVRFIVGPTALNVSTLSVSWPNGGNPWRSVCTNSTTAAKIATINSTINACGLVLEPGGGILPPGAQVVLVTSVNMDVNANSFANLTDTIYMIFQCAGNTQGHFKNYGVGVGTRTLSMTFGSGCSDVVTYSPGKLTTPSGFVGDGPGATVLFDWTGSDTYHNYGCQAPIDIASVELQTNKTTLCEGDSVFAAATIQNLTVTSITWSGGTGTFSNPNNITTYYIAGSGDNGTITLYATITGTCGNNLSDSIKLTIPGNFISALLVDPPAPHCNGDLVTLTMNGGNIYNWSNGATTPAITVSTDGTYSVNASNACYTNADSTTITFSSVTAAFTTDISSGPAPLTVSFFNQSINANLWQFDFGDGFTDNTSMPAHTYQTAGSYQVVLNVKNIDGCTDIAIHEILVSGDTVAFFPSSFTPNSDGRNDFFKPFGSNILNSTCSIYNRWGQKIYTWENSSGWNGSSEGKDAEQGFYTYVADISFIWGQTIRKRGWLMLLR